MSMSTGQSFRYKAFISYNHRDLKFAKSLHKRLENYTFSQSGGFRKEKPLFPIFLDESELKAGSSLSDAIQEAIRTSEYLIVISSENSVKSHWVKAELSYMRELGRGDDIIGVIPDKHGDETHLSHLFGKDSDPLGADFRSGKNTYLQLSKIAATIMDIELDELYRRESRRKNKQMLGLGAGLTAIATLMTGLAANAYFAEKEAVRQRQQSEEVIAFMIDEFRDDLEKLDKLDLLSDVGEKAEDYFNDRDLDLLSDESILLQSRTLRQLADVDEKRGDISLAKQRVVSAHRASELMLERLPDNKNAIKEHAENSDYWGYLEYQLGHLKTAKDLFETAKTVYEHGAITFPDDTQLEWKKNVADQNIGIMLLQLGHAEDGRPYLERTLRSVEKQYDARKLTEDELYEYAGMYTWYIRALPDDTSLSFLYDTRQKQLSLFQDMRENGARTILNQSEKLNVERAVVILLLHAGRDDEAHALMQSIQKEFETLIEHDPNNVGWRRHLIRSKLTLGLLHHKYGRANARDQEIDEAKALTLKADGEKWGLTSDIDRRMNRLTAYRLFDDASLEDALAVLTAAEKKIEDRWKGDYRPRVRYNLSSLKSFKAELYTKKGRMAEAQDQHQQILELLSGKDSYSMAEQKLQLAAYRGLNKINEVRSLKEKLEARGVAVDD